MEPFLAIVIGIVVLVVSASIAYKLADKKKDPSYDV
jgi:hypothetical protein